MTRTLSRALLAIWIGIIASTLLFPERNNRSFEWKFEIGPNTLEASDLAPIRVLGVHHELQFAQVPGFQGKQVWVGVEYDLLMDWARENHRKIEFISYARPEEAERDFLNGKGDILAGRWSQTLKHNLWLETSPFEKTNLALYCPERGRSQPQLPRLQVDRRYFYDFNKARFFSKQIKQIEFRNFSASLHDETEESEFCLALEERWADFEIKFKPQFRKDRVLRRNVNLVWRLPPARSDLRTSLNIWLNQQKKNGHLQRIQSRYYSALRSLVKSDIHGLEENLIQRFPNYQELFENSARDKKIPWTLLAAVGYQESHWNNLAVSPTKVRGIMQITRPTAHFLGVTDILDVEQTIPAGARYIEYLWSLWPESLSHRERVKLTLISYNMGYQHVLDAQRWLVGRKLDPYSWHNIVQALRAKESEQLSGEFNLGYARGSEAIKFAERVLSFETFLRRVLSQPISPLQLSSLDL